jgi:hypothetical protein
MSVSVRLTDNIRRKIVKRLLDHAFRAERQEVEELEMKLGKMVYDEIYDSETYEKMRDLPIGFFDESANIHVAFGGRRDFVRVTGPVAACHLGYDNVFSYAASDPKSKLHADIYKRKEDLKEKEQKAAAAAMALLGSASTLRRLLEVWPEVSQFTPELIAQQARRPSQQLTVSVAGLNRQLKLGKNHPVDHSS